MDDILDIFGNKKFLRLWLAGTSSGIARWLEVMCFSVFAWQISGDATIAGFLMTSRFAGVILTGILFLFIGSRVSGQITMILMHVLLSANCCIGFSFDLDSSEQIVLFSIISFCSGMLWSADFSFRRRMLADRLEGAFIGKGLAIDVTSTHATRLIAMFIGGIIISMEQIEILLVLLLTLYTLPFISFYFERDSSRLRTHVKFAFKSVFAQARDKTSIRLVLLLTPIYNIFVLPYLALITLVFLERFRLEADLSGYLSSLEGAGALFGGILISLLQPRRKQLTFICALIGLLIAIFLLGNFPYLIGVIIILFSAGIMSAVYSSMQSTLIYVNSRTSLRSPTFSLMTVAIGIGLLGTSNIAWMGKHFSVSYILMFMALEGLMVLIAIFAIFWIFKKFVN